jgi:hypothetical protein
MDRESIILKIEKTLDKLYVKDWYLLKNKIHERTITHKIAEYLQEYFTEYDVDCEYDFDIDNHNGNLKKQFHDIATKELNYRKNEINKLIQNELININDMNNLIEIFLRNFYPDIIVHKRGTNRQNLLIIEAKKNNNTEFDEKKLIANTRINLASGSNLNYNLGCLIILSVGDNFNRKDVILKYFPQTE